MPIQLTLPGLARLAPPVAMPPERLPLWNYPDVTGDVCSRNAKALGLSAEHLAASELIRRGLMIAKMPEHLPFDLFVMIAPWGVRVQVKSTTAPAGDAYSFSMVRGYHRSPDGVRGYGADDYDIAALVVLPLNVVLFTAEKRPGHRMTRADVEALRNGPNRSLDEALLRLGIEVETPAADPMPTLQ